MFDNNVNFDRGFERQEGSCRFVFNIARNFRFGLKNIFVAFAQERTSQIEGGLDRLTKVCISSVFIKLG